MGQVETFQKNFDHFLRFIVWQICSCKELKVELWAGWGCFHDHNFTLKYHIHNYSALYFDMQPYWKFYQLIFDGKMSLKLNFDLKLRSFN